MIRFGTSGRSDDHWVGVLYPERTPVSARLARYVHGFDTVELNASFYRWPKDSTFAGWRQRLKQGSVKAHRGLTHFRRLKSTEPWVERFERYWRLLGDRAEMLRVQLHPEQQRDDVRLDHFLGLMPDWIFVAVELRHPSWDAPRRVRPSAATPRSLRRDERCRPPCIARSTTDVVYVRMHGPGESLYAGSYSDADLQRWAVSPSGRGKAATGSSISTMTATARPCRTQRR